MSKLTYTVALRPRTCDGSFAGVTALTRRQGGATHPHYFSEDDALEYRPAEMARRAIHRTYDVDGYELSVEPAPLFTALSRSAPWGAFIVTARLSERTAA